MAYDGLRPYPRVLERNRMIYPALRDDMTACIPGK